MYSLPRKVPTDVYVDPSKRANWERMQSVEQNVSHKPFMSSCRAAEKGTHGGWEGTFAQLHGGYPYVLESSMPEPKKSKREPPAIQQPRTVRVNKVKKGGPGVPNLTIGPEYEYENPGDYETQERMQRAYKLGVGGGFRSNERAWGRPFCPANPVSGLFDPSLNHDATSGVEQEKKQRKGPISAAGKIARRAVHATPFNSSAPRKTGVFSRYEPMPEEYVSNARKTLDASMKRNQLPTLINPPFVPATTCKKALPTKTIAFHKYAR